ncbi:hypothetical protein [Egbenema bharatensis]|uniref:hypothetical protein n=1 Tax=Egbenema bharatensis TaxID=3463334 RepID=UPI003A87A1A9
MTKPGNLDSNDLPGDSDERLFFALNLKEGLDPQGVIEDWGDFNNDYRDDAHDEANALPQTQDDSGVGFSSSEEVQTYYDSLVSEDITIIEREDP